MVVLPLPQSIRKMQLAPGSLVTLLAVSWAEFEALLESLGDRRSARVAYSHGTLEIMVPLPEHEIPTDLISDIVKLLLRASRQPFQPFGSTTFRKEGQAGIEPDACFYVKNYRQMIGKRRLQPNDPPPDLAIETDLTSKTAIAAYEAIAVPEVWIYDSGILDIQLLKDGKYQRSERSELLPDLDIRQLVTETIERSWAVGSYQALEELREQLGL